MWWGSYNGYFNGDLQGRKIDGEPEHIPTPDFARVIKVRLLIGDPDVSLIGFVEELPSGMEKPFKGAILTLGKGEYFQWRDIPQMPEKEPEIEEEGEEEPPEPIEPEPPIIGQWVKIELRTPDVEIEFLKGSIFETAKKIIKKMMTKIDVSGYITSFSAGGQNTSFASPADMLELLEKKLQFLNELEGKKHPLFMVQKSAVGWSYE